MIAGVHFVPLRKPGGDPASHIGIFVKIQLNQDQVTDELEVPISPLSDTLLSELLEDTNAVKNSQCNHDSYTTDVTDSESTELSNRDTYKPQITVTADVHFDQNSSNISSNC